MPTRKEMPGISWETLLRMMPFNVYVFNRAKQTIEYLNRYTASDLGYSDAEIEQMGEQWFIGLLHPEDRENLPAMLARWDRVKDGEVLETEYRLRAPNGDYRWFMGRDVVIERGESGEVIKFLGTTLDISANKALEQRLAKAQKLEALGRMARGISHDFNNLLTVVAGNVALVRQLSRRGASVDEPLASIEAVAARASELNGQLVAFAREQVVQPVRADLGALIGGVLPLLRRLAGDDIEVIFQPAAEPLGVLLDPSQLSQVMANLVLNARDAMEQGGTVTVRLGLLISEGRWASVVVEDTGVGMTSDTLGRIFEPFFTTKPQGRGTGLGLSMVYGFVSQSGGHVSVSSRPGEGSRFELRFPLREAAA